MDAQCGVIIKVRLEVNHLGRLHGHFDWDGHAGVQGGRIDRDVQGITDRRLRHEHHPPMQPAAIIQQPAAHGYKSSTRWKI